MQILHAVSYYGVMLLLAFPCAQLFILSSGQDHLPHVNVGWGSAKTVIRVIPARRYLT